jgi:YidC/Oxa1 family membrane protein insertase
MAFYWLNASAYKSMAKMRVLTPKLMKLKETYGDDKQRLNQEMMALYKRHGIKFMGLEGCFPLFLQIPVFFALFTTLSNAYELHQAPWIGWVKDLSVHDPYFVLPILMGGGMFVQQKMTMSSMDPSQKQIMYIMPIMFTFFFLKMPSGLVIYWLTNSLLTISVQWYLMRRAAAVEVVK